MIDIYIIYAICVSLSFLLALLALFPVGMKKSILVVTVFSAILLIQFPAMVSMMSHPRPVEWMLVQPNPDEADMLALEVLEGEHMDMLLHWDGLSHSRWFRFPWDEEFMDDLEEAKQGNPSENPEDGLMLQKPFDKTLDRRKFPWVIPDPQHRTMPQKRDQQKPDEVIEYERDA